MEAQIKGSLETATLKADKNTALQNKEISFLKSEILKDAEIIKSDVERIRCKKGKEIGHITQLMALTQQNHQTISLFNLSRMQSMTAEPCACFSVSTRPGFFEYCEEHVLQLELANRILRLEMKVFLVKK